ncbi:MAG: NAD-dependent epimerase/dehydratase family protein [Steroidobacteraceae bacterium]
MSRSAIIFGGTGYIGSRLAEFLMRRGWGPVLLADIKPPSRSMPQGVVYARCDVRRPILGQVGMHYGEWIFNFAAIHREPGHGFREYFDTNIPGARNVCAYADQVECKNIVFTSSIAVYGDITDPTDETVRTYPDTGYGISKLCAELIHEGWQTADIGRRLIIVRPGVVYGPGDPGNILRLIRAIQKGIFVMPGDGSVRKSYAYIYGLLESMEFMMARAEPYLCYNYVERDTDTLSELVDSITAELGIRRARLRVSKSLLVALARVAQVATGGRSPIHPVRVRKAAQSTHIVPAELIRLNFDFRYDFAKSLRHWKSMAPDDFDPGRPVNR